MQVPVQINFVGMPHSDALEAKIREKVAKLEHIHPRIISCRVAMQEEARRKRQGKMFGVRVDMHIPGHELVINKEACEDAYVAVREAFDAALRLLEEKGRAQRGQVKRHEVPLHGQVARIDADSGHGYIETPDGAEVYFSRENVANPLFDQLEVGADVQFLLEHGKDTLLARRVSAGKHRFGG